MESCTNNKQVGIVKPDSGDYVMASKDTPWPVQMVSNRYVRDRIRIMITVHLK